MGVKDVIRRGASAVNAVNKNAPYADKALPKSIRYTTQDDFWVQPFNFEAVIDWPLLYRIRTEERYHLFKIGTAVGIMMICVFVAAVVTRSPVSLNVMSILTNAVLVPYVVLFFVSEMTCIDRKLITTLCKKFEFMYFVGLVFSLFYPAAIDVLLSTDDTTSHAMAVAALIAGPMPFVWVAIHDASVRRFRITTLAVVSLLTFATALVYSTLVGVFPAFNGFFRSTEYCVPANFDREFQKCATVMDTFVEPTTLQLTIFLVKYMIHMVKTPDLPIMLQGTLSRSLSKKDASELRHLQDPENSLHGGKYTQEEEKTAEAADSEEAEAADSEEAEASAVGVSTEEVQISVVKTNERN